MKNLKEINKGDTIIRKAFIISPIGEEGTHVRKHANEVRDFLIKPALEELKEICHIEIQRSDEMVEAGRITEQIYTAIREGDLCIVDCSFLNPNVFYELAIAQCTVKPVIILAKKGTRLPFDIKDERTIFFELDLTSYRDRIYINRIVDIVKNLEKNNWEIESSIPGFSPTDKKQEREYRYFEESGNFKNWNDILFKADRLFYIMGIKLGGWFAMGKDKLAEILLKKAKKGCKAKILMMHKDNPAISNLINDDLSDETEESFIKSMEDNWQIYSKIAESHENIEVRQLKSGTMTHSKYINDNYGYYIPFFYSKRNKFTPLWECKPGTHLYNILLDDFNFLWNMSS
ncbi:MAG: hypothetical protein ACFFBI_13535 [Promethearchaeota archaeon]